MDDRTRELVDAAEARANVATPGDWGVDAPYTRRALLVFACDMPKQFVIAEMKDEPNWNNDADFIAHARTDVPALCAVIREQDATIARLTEERDAARRQAHIAESMITHEDD